MTSTDHVTHALSVAEEPLPTQQMFPAKRLRVALLLLAGCIALLMTGFGIIVPVFPQRLTALGLGAEMLALMEGAFGLGMFLLSPPLGILADRIGRKPIVLISLAGFMLTNLVLGTVTLPILFLLIRFVEGALISGLMPASMAMIGDSVPRKQQSRWTGFLLTAQAAGFALGPGIGGFLSQIWGFSSPFFISAALACLAALLALLLLPETLSEQARTQAQRPSSQQHQNGKRSQDRLSGVLPHLLTFLPFLLIDCGITFLYPFVLPQYPFFFAKVLGYSAAQFGVLVSAYSLALAAFPLFLGRLSEVFSQRLLVTLGSLLYGALNAAMLFLHPYLLLLGAALLTGIGNALLIPALGTLYLGGTTERNRSQVMGIRGTAIALGTLLGPLAQALADLWITPRMTFALALALSLMMTLLALVIVPRGERA